MKGWELWLNGLVGGFIGAGASVISVVIVDPAKFSPTADGGWKHLGLCVLISGITGAALYLKQHPTPWDGVDRRSTDPDVPPKAGS